MPKLEKLLLSPPPKRKTSGGEKRRFYREGIGFGSALVLPGEGTAVAQVAFDDKDLDWTQISLDVDEWDFSDEAARVLIGGAINVMIAQSRSRFEGAFRGVVSDEELAGMLEEPQYRMTEPL